MMDSCGGGKERERKKKEEDLGENDGEGSRTLLYFHPAGA